MDAIVFALLCKALSDSNRVKIVELLVNGEMCGCKRLDNLQITQPTLSHHMKILSECGLVKSRRVWKNIYYSLNCETLTAFQNYVEHLKCGPSCMALAEDDLC